MIFAAAPGGGEQRGNVTLANAFVDCGISTVYVMPKAGGPFLGELSRKVWLIDLGTASRIRSAIRLALLLRRERPEAIIASHTFGVNAAVAARSIARIDTQVIGVQHNVLSEVCRHGSIKMRLLMPPIVRATYPKANALVAVSHGVAKDLFVMTGIPAERIVVIPSTTITRSIEQRAAEKSGHVWLDSKATPVILAVGDLRTVKDYATLLRAFVRVRRVRAARLIVLGEGSERGRLETLTNELGLEDDVSFPGHKANPYAYMARADLLVLSSKHEGFGNVLVEAMACGCPVVSTDCPHGPREILASGRHGELVPVGDSFKMAEAIHSSLDNSESAWTRRRRLRERAAEFSVDAAATKYLHLINQGAAHRCPTSS